ncbi:hypothetical protein ABI59_18925 [Acidobacteria bacterium Mor1]|nr:hypothetical protein ABI59_18925 [Acidobacteria bacterium Mor1]
MTAKPSAKEWIAAGLLVAVLLVFHWVTLPDGHSWGGDFAMYMAHADNMTGGKAYTDTGYVFNPYHPRVGPRNYPPGFPMMLALPYAVHGDFDFREHVTAGVEALKRWVVLLFAAFLLVLYPYCRGRLSPLGAGVVVAAVGLNPYLWQLKGSLASEVPFFLFLYLGLWLAEKIPGERREGNIDIVLGVAAGLALYMAYATRSVGLVFIPAVLLHDVWRFRRLRRGSLVLLAVAIPLMVFQNISLDILADYGDAVGGAMKESQGPVAKAIGMAKNALSNVGRFPLVFSWSWGGGLPGAMDKGITGILYLTAFIGGWHLLRERIGLSEIFALGYVSALALLPFGGDTRRLVPVLPIFLIFVARSYFDGPLTEDAPPKRRGAKVMAMVLGLLLLTAYVGAYQKFDIGGELEDGVHRADAQEMFSAVKELSEDSICLFFKPRVLAYYTERGSVGFQVGGDTPEQLLGFVEELGVTHVVAGPGDEANAPLRFFASTYPERLYETWSNNRFTIYGVVDETMEAAEDAPGSAALESE